MTHQNWPQQRKKRKWKWMEERVMIGRIGRRIEVVSLWRESRETPMAAPWPIATTNQST